MGKSINQQHWKLSGISQIFKTINMELTKTQRDYVHKFYKWLVKFESTLRIATANSVRTNYHLSSKIKEDYKEKQTMSKKCNISETTYN